MMRTTQPEHNKDDSLISEDVTERQQAEAALYKANRAYKVRSECNQALVRATEETELLQKVCRIIIEVGGYGIAWVGFAEEDEAKNVRPAAHVGYGKGYLDAVNSAWADIEQEDNPFSAAIRTRKPIIKNILTNPDDTLWCNEAAKHSYISSIALPLLTDGQILGVLNICSPKPNSFDDQEVSLLMELANDLAFGIKILRMRVKYKRAEEALKKSESRAKALLEAIPDLMFRLNSQGVYLDYQAAESDLYTQTEDTIIGKSNHDIFPPEFADFVNQKIKDTLDSGEIQLFEYQLPIPGRGQVDYEARMVKDGADEVIAIIRDITERKRAEESLRQLNLAIEQSPVSVMITDTEGVIQYVNPWFSQITGYSAAEVAGQHSRLLKSGRTTAEEYRQLWSTITSGKTWRGEFYNKKKDGSYYWVSAAISPVFDEAGQITHYLAIENVTERKVMQDQLRRRNRELQLLNRASQVISSSLDLDKILATMLEETRRLLDVTACSVWLIDAETGELVCEQVTDPRATIVRGWRLALGQGIAGWVALHGESLIVPNIHDDERHFGGIDEQTGLLIHSILTVPLRVNQNVIGIFQVVDELPDRFTLRDLQLTESLAIVAANAIENARLHKDLQRQLDRLKDAQSRLVQSEKLAAIGELIAGVAHELNNPLASTILYSQLLQAKGVSEEMSRDLDQIVAQARRASAVVRGLLDFARQRPSERSATQVNDVIKSTIELLSYELRKHNITIFDQLAPDLPITMVDPHQLQQLLVNLINNAVQAMDKSQIGDRVTILSEAGKSNFWQENDPQSSPMIRIMIQDNGPGIPPEIQSRIFDPFFTTKGPGEGTGLGLSVCHGIVSEHEGHIWVKSEVGQGTTFFIELPIVAPPGQGQTSNANIDPQSSTAADEKYRILVIDDEPGVLTVITRILRRKGYLVDGVGNGKAGLEQLTNTTYDLILCDLRMPGMDGSEFYRNAVQKYPKLAHQVIFTTGDTVSANTCRFLEDVKADCLLKPFELADLVSVVREKLAG